PQPTRPRSVPTRRSSELRGTARSPVRGARRRGRPLRALPPDRGTRCPRPGQSEWRLLPRRRCALARHDAFEYRCRTPSGHRHCRWGHCAQGGARDGHLIQTLQPWYLTESTPSTPAEISWNDCYWARRPCTGPCCICSRPASQALVASQLTWCTWRQHLAQQTVTKDDFEQMLMNSFIDNEPLEGTVVKGRVVGIEKDLAIIDVGLKTEGRVAL